MSMNSHIGKVSSKAFRSLYIIRQTKKFLSKETTQIWYILSSYHTSITVTHCSMVFYSSNMTVYKGFSMQRRVWSAWSLNSTISLPLWEDYTGVQLVTEWCLRYCSSCISSVDRYSLRSLTVWIRCWFPEQRLKPAVIEPCQSGTLPVEWVWERHQESIWQLTFLEQIYGYSRVHFGFYHKIDMIIIV